jgi:hypothetical protein
MWNSLLETSTPPPPHYAPPETGGTSSAVVFAQSISRQVTGQLPDLLAHQHNAVIIARDIAEKMIDSRTHENVLETCMHVAHALQQVVTMHRQQNPAAAADPLSPPSPRRQLLVCLSVFAVATDLLGCFGTSSKDLIRRPRPIVPCSDELLAVNQLIRFLWQHVAPLCIYNMTYRFRRSGG